MNTRIYFSLSILMLFSLTACQSGPKLFWDTDEGAGQPAYAQGKGGSAAAEQRAPLDVPPALRAELQVPSGESVATVTEEAALPGSYRKAVVGKYVALDAKIYDATAAQVFSAAVDAMTALNLPVQSVDSPSGTLTTDWIRKGGGNGNALGMFSNLFDFGSGPKIVRYRYVARVMRATVAGQAGPRAQLEIRTIGQVYNGHNWVNAQLKEKVAQDLFSAFEEQLASTQAQAPKAADAAAALPADEPAESLGNQ